MKCKSVGLILLLALLALASCRAGIGSTGFAAAGLGPRPTAVLLATETPAPLAFPAAAPKPSPAAPAPATALAPTRPSAPSTSSTPSTAPASSTPAVRIMAVGARPSLPLRSLPSSAAPVVATLPGSDVFWAGGRSAGGAWLRLAYGENGAAAWAAASDLTLFGDPALLPILRDEASGPMAGGPALTPSPGRAWPGRTLVDQLRVRAGPGADQPVVAALAAGQAISVTGRSQDAAWLAIRWPQAGQPGAAAAWVAAPYVAVYGVNGIQDLPVAPAPSGSAYPAPAASAPATVGLIAFQTRSGGDIYILNADGSGLRRVARGLDPALAPGGARLAYARWDGPEPGIYLLDLVSGQDRRVAAAAEPRSPAWSPDGGKLAFARAEGVRNCISTPFGCFDDASAQAVFHGQDCITTPFGRFCLSDFPRVQQTQTRLTQVTLDPGQLDDLPAQSPVQSLTWRPNGAQIVFRGSKGLQVLEGGQDLRLLVNDAAVGSPAWSPDGQRLAVQVHVHDHADIFLLDASGGNRVALTRPDPFAARPVNNVAPAWSPDGAQILFLTDREGPWRLYVMNADGSAQRPFLPFALSSISFNYDYAAERMASWAR